MKFVRTFDAAEAFPTGHPGYSAQFVSHLESALVIGSWIEAGGCGPGLHYHDSDQSYYLVAGDMTVQIGHDTHAVPAGSFVHIPAGVAHRNWNDSDSTEFHMELIVPAPTPGSPLLHPVARPEDAPGSAHSGFVTTVLHGDFTEPPGLPGLAYRQILHNDNSVVNAFRMAPGGEGPGTHIHEFDQYYFVLEGVLEVEVALQRHSAPAGTAVLLPAGVPHRQWNSGDGIEVHLALLAPAPLPDTPWDRGVEFRFTGVHHSG